MKRLFCLFSCLLLILISGCSKNSTVKPVTYGLSFTAEVSYKDNTTVYEVVIDENSVTTLKAISNDLKGMSYIFSDQTVTEKFNSLEHKTYISSLPKGIITDFIHSVFLTLTDEKPPVETENDQYIIHGKNRRYCFKIIFGETGLPIKIEDKENGITVLIKNSTLLKE